MAWSEEDSRIDVRHARSHATVSRTARLPYSGNVKPLTLALAVVRERARSFLTRYLKTPTRCSRVSLMLSGLRAASQPLAAQTAEGSWMIRVRALSLTPANKSDAIPSLGVAADTITVSDKIFPEVDISYFFGKHFAAELVLTYPQKHDVELNDSEIGTFNQLPPTLLTNDEISVLGVGALTLSDKSVGAAGQVGVDVKVRAGQFLNLDVKRVEIRYVVKDNSEPPAYIRYKVSAVQVSPWLVSVGYGFRF